MIREMKIKTKMRLYLISVIMAIIKISTNNNNKLLITNDVGDVQKKEPFYTVGGNINRVCRVAI